MYGVWHRPGVRGMWILTLCFLLGMGLPLAVSTAWAHGGGTPQLANADAGPYWVSVWTQPDPLQVGEAHITVAVSEPGVAHDGHREAGAPVLDAVVELRFERLDRPGETATALATHEGAANKLFYEADLAFPDAGHWDVRILVQGPDGEGSASFDSQVSSPNSFNWPYVIGLGLLGVVVVGVVQRLRERSGDRVE